MPRLSPEEFDAAVHRAVSGMNTGEKLDEETRRNMARTSVPQDLSVQLSVELGLSADQADDAVLIMQSWIMRTYNGRVFPEIPLGDRYAWATRYVGYLLSGGKPTREKNVPGPTWSNS